MGFINSKVATGLEKEEYKREANRTVLQPLLEYLLLPACMFRRETEEFLLFSVESISSAQIYNAFEKILTLFKTSGKIPTSQNRTGSPKSNHKIRGGVRDTVHSFLRLE